MLDTKRPPSEIMALPASDLEWWSLFYSLEDKPLKPEPVKQSMKESKAKFASLMTNWKGKKK